MSANRRGVGGRGGASNLSAKRRDSTALSKMRSRRSQRNFIVAAMLGMCIKAAHPSNPAFQKGGRDKSGSCKTRPAFCPDIVIVRLQSPHSSRWDRRSDAELFSRPFGTCGVWSHGPGTGVPGYCPMSLRDKASVPLLLSRPPFSKRRPPRAGAHRPPRRCRW
jgi:hypothetical protein